MDLEKVQRKATKMINGYEEIKMAWTSQFGEKEAKGWDDQGLQNHEGGR